MALEGASEVSSVSLSPLSGEVGSGNPLLVRAVAPDAGWAVLCQAREDSNHDGEIAVRVGARGQLMGDRLDGFLIEGSGTGEPIQAFVTGDASGRYLVFERAGRLILRDSWNQSEVDLSTSGAETGTDLSPFTEHRAARFSPDGERMLYLRREGQRERVVVRELESAEEVVFEPGEGLLWRAEFDESSAWLLMRVVDADTNGDGRWDWPHGAPTLEGSPCTSPIPAYRAPVVPSDKPSVRVAPVGGGKVRQVRGYAAGFGPFGWVRRPEDRALFVDYPGVPSQLWSPSLCDGRLLHADAARGLLVVACASEEGPRSVELTGRDFRQPLGLSVAPFELDGIVPGQPRFVPVYGYPGMQTSVIDLDARELIALMPRDRVVATAGAMVLVRRNDSLYLGDPRGELRLVGPVDPLSLILREPPMVFMAPWVIDMAQGRVLGRVSAGGLALSRQGAVLVAREAGDVGHLPSGPLTWVHSDGAAVDTAVALRGRGHR